MVGFANSLMWQFAGPDNYSSQHDSGFQPGAAAAAGGRPGAGDGAAHDFRAGAVGERAADGALPARVLLERGDGPRSGPGAEPPRRFVGRQRLGRFQRRRRRRLRPRGRRRAAARRTSRSASPAARAPSRPAVTSGCCKRRRSFAINTRTSPALGDSLEQLQAANEAGRIDRFQVDLARQALYNAQSQLLNNENAYARRARQFQVAARFAAVAGREDRRSAAGSFQFARSRISRSCRFE